MADGSTTPSATSVLCRARQPVRRPQAWPARSPALPTEPPCRALRGHGGVIAGAELVGTRAAEADPLQPTEEQTRHEIARCRRSWTSVQEESSEPRAPFAAFGKRTSATRRLNTRSIANVGNAGGPCDTMTTHSHFPYWLLRHAYVEEGRRMDTSVYLLAVWPVVSISTGQGHHDR